MTSQDVHISVVMLTHNRESMVGRAIEAIVKQSFSQFELIIVNNGSTDKSGVIADKWAEKDSRIHVIHTDECSIASGRNIGVARSIGSYIAFVDDDDFAENDMLEFLWNMVMNHDADIALCGSYKEIGDAIFPNYVFDELLVMTSEEAVTEMLKREKYNVAMPTKLIRKDLLLKVPFNENSRYDDIWVGYRLFALSALTVAHGLPKYRFRRHETNNSAFTTSDHLLNEDQLEEYLNAFRERTIYLSNLLPKIADYALYSEYSWMISMCNKVISSNLQHCSAKLDQMRAELRKNYNWFYTSPYIKDFEKKYMEMYIA